MEKKPVTVQQATESVKINAGPSYAFFLLCFMRDMADASVGVFVGEEEQLCVSCFKLYMGEGEGLMFLFVWHSKIYSSEVEKEGASTAVAAAYQSG